MDDMPELYLTSTDAKTWLGIQSYQLHALHRELGLEKCGGKGRPCRLHKADLLLLRAVVNIMHETGVEPGAAVKGHRALKARAAAMNDYILVCRKPGEGTPVPALWDGEINPGGWVTTDEWIRDARGFWADIRETDVLTGWRDAREEDDEKHVCPLQLEVIRRLVRLYSNPDALVLDPFMGIGSTAVIALEQGRRAVGFELKESYHRQALANCERELQRQRAEKTLPLFELAGLEVPA